MITLVALHGVVWSQILESQVKVISSNEGYIFTKRKGTGFKAVDCYMNSQYWNDVGQNSGNALRCV